MARLKKKNKKQKKSKNQYPYRLIRLLLTALFFVRRVITDSPPDPQHAGGGQNNMNTN